MALKNIHLLFQNSKFSINNKNKEWVLVKTHNMILSKVNTLKNQQLGYNLREVMVATLILSTVILGIASLQMIGVKGTQRSLIKQQAMGIVQNMI